MFVIIVGGGKTGSQLAQGLLEEGHQICIIEGRDSVVERLQEELPEEVDPGRGWQLASDAGKRRGRSRPGAGGGYRVKMKPTWSSAPWPAWSLMCRV